MQILWPVLLAVAEAAVASSRWRLVGRDAVSSWVVNGIGFFSDAACATRIQARPFRSLQGNSQRYDGSAFSAPNYVRPTSLPADVFEEQSGSWETGVPCPSSGDTCQIGFHWLTDQVEAATGGFATVGRLTVGSAEPRCIALDQSTQANQHAPTILVQYWSASLRSWQDHTTFSSLSGGLSNLRLPEVPLR
mmetsp:Transcript_23556/g.44472  ORF Transcript_23556/g.44472 Transcript_23556/m.44472 type:complete len:191 (+) Transcript_23556:79-651(+)